MAERDPPAEITPLDDRTVREIAAGEVVERPASVVKELVENSLDAGASRVAVAVENGGIDGIRVRDDGHGIPPDQLERAVAEHATSKLGGIAELDAGVGSLGFRGEALYTVGAVSRLTVRSRPPDRPSGASVVVDHGDTGPVESAGCPVGTTVSVAELFGETPARRKFLKTAATEFDRINAVVSAYALANPEVAVSLEHDDRELFATPGDGELRTAVLAVYGREVAESMVEVSGSRSVSVGGASREVRVHGLVSEPETTRASRSYLTTFVRDRWVQDAALRSAVVDAYGGQLAADRYPFATLFVDVPAAAVDVNVHPRKSEVRFDDDAAVVETVREAVREGLLSAGLLRTSAPRGESAPAETELDPEVLGGAGHGGRPADDREADETTGTTGGGDTATVDNQGEATADARREATTDDSQKATADSESETTADDERETTPDERDETTTDAVLSAWGETGDDDVTATGDHATDADETTATADHTTDDVTATGDHATDSDAATAGDGPTPREWQADDDRTVPGQHTLTGGRTDDWRDHNTLPSLRVLGQYDDTYVVCATDDGLVLVDQHAADERVNYERLRRAAGLPADTGSETGADETSDDSGGSDGSDDPTVQALAEPVEIPLTAREAALFDQFRDALATAGFHARVVERDATDDTATDDQLSEDATPTHTVAVTAVPAVFDAALDPELLRDTLVSFAEDVTARDRPAVAAADDLLADLACYPSITGNTSLTEGSVTELLDALDGCENPYACPHGRPVLVRFDAAEVDSRFERDYPGHGDRREVSGDTTPTDARRE